MSLQPTTVIAYYRTPVLDGLGGEIENPTAGTVFGAATGYKVTKNYHRVLRSSIVRQEEAKSPTMGPGVMTRTEVFFTFEPNIPAAEPMGVSDYLDDGTRYRVTKIHSYDAMTQVDAELIT